MTDNQDPADRPDQENHSDRPDNVNRPGNEDWPRPLDAVADLEPKRQSTLPVLRGSADGTARRDIERIDIHATHEYRGVRMRAGRPLPFGANRIPGGINFSIFSRHATGCWLVLYEKHATEPTIEVPIPDEFRVGDVWCVVVFDLDYENIEYGYRMEGPWDPIRGHRFDKHVVLLDPYAKVIGGRDVWGTTPTEDDAYPHRARIVFDDFDWQGDIPPRLRFEDLIIYEMHVRGFTRHPSAEVRHPGTFAAIRDKIPYLKALGVNAVELMPVFEFDECENPRKNPYTGERLKNYWGYSSIGFFAPKAGYAASGRFSMQVDELKTLVRTLHKAGIEVILDVVFNHTGEGDHRGPTISYKGIDNETYYMLTPDGAYLNFSGTGNTMNCNHPIVRNMVVDCLRYWVSEYHIDGFRFDLAAIMGRGIDGAPLDNPPLLEAMSHDPILADVKLIAEAWDAGGLYMVGNFPAYNRWAEWNGKYRDCMRRFLRGDPGQIPEVMQRLQGSPDLYGFRGTTASINFITCHDGFTLHDLFAYDHKHNFENGENNRDGGDWNESWNHGIEGPTDDPDIRFVRSRQMRNALVLLMMSHGVPMLLMGDEVARTQHGNNNAYCQDNEKIWLDWSVLQENPSLFRFFQHLIGFRNRTQVLRTPTHSPTETHHHHGSWPELSFHGVHCWHPDTSHYSHTLAVMMCQQAARSGEAAPAGPADPSALVDEFIYAAFNMHTDDHSFELPTLPAGWDWHLVCDTGRHPPNDVCAPGSEVRLADQRRVSVHNRACVVAIGKPVTDEDDG